MNIRQWLLQLLIPPLILFIVLMSSIFYFNWYKEINTSFESYIKSAVFTLSQSVNTKDVNWLKEHDSSEWQQSLAFKRLNNSLNHLNQNFPFINLKVIAFKKDPNTNKYEEIILASSPQEDLFPVKISEEELEELSKPDQTVFSRKNTIKAGKEILTFFAPIYNEDGTSVGFVAADIDSHVMNQKLKFALLIIIVSAIVTILLTLLSVFFAADKISKPIQKLNNAALAIAAGDTDEPVDVKGPKELSELANNLNIMNECLQENITRLKETSVTRERVYGEYECAQLLQKHMLDYVIENFEEKGLALHHFKIAATSSPYGLLLETSKDNSLVKLKLFEALEKGFTGIYQLLNDHSKNPRFLELQIDKRQGVCSVDYRKMPTPLHWIASQKKLELINQNTTLKENDLVFIYNNGFEHCFENQAQIEAWFKKLLWHFANEGFSLFANMINNEMHFLARKRHVEWDMHLLCIQINFLDS